MLSKLYEHTGVVIDQPGLAEWSTVFRNAKMPTASLERLTHQCHIVRRATRVIAFFRAGATAKKRIKAREQARKGSGKADEGASVAVGLAEKVAA